MSYVRNIKEKAYILKYELYNFKYQELREKYLSTNKNMILFLENVKQLLQDDPYFLYLEEDNIEFIYSLVNEYRFMKNADKKLMEVENDILRNLNIIKERKNDYLLEIYIDEQKEIRALKGNIETVLPYYISYDYEVIKALKEKNTEELDKILYLSSSFYLIRKFPELYLDNRDIREESFDSLKLLGLERKKIISDNAKILNNSIHKLLTKTKV